jgi:hypothetical protein
MYLLAASTTPRARLVPEQPLIIADVGFKIAVNLAFMLDTKTEIK